MTRGQAFRLIILPQAWRASLPPMVNEMTFLIKSSPAIAVIGVVDLTRTASRIAAYTYDPLPPYISAAIIYAIVVFALVRAQRAIEHLIIRKYGVL
jgi:ABC-type amino acid transport system permease subunit